MNRLTWVTSVIGNMPVLCTMTVINKVSSEWNTVADLDTCGDHLQMQYMHTHIQYMEQSRVLDIMFSAMTISVTHINALAYMATCILGLL